MTDSNNLDRREFIKATTVLGAGVVLAPYIITGKSKEAKELNIALIGAGAQGQVLVNACLKIPNIKFRAICDIWESYNLLRVSNLLTKYGHKLNSYIDYKEMLAKEKNLDAVIIASPDFWHSQHAVDCMEAGLHVYCEKEMSNTLEGAKRIVNAARRTKRVVQIGHQRRSNPYYLHSYNKILKEAHLLGKITTINGQWNRAVQPDNGWPTGKEIPNSILDKYGFANMHQHRNWRWYRNLGGGPIVDLGSHQIDIYNWFLNSPPISVMASGGTDYYDRKTHEWYDTVLATFKYKTKDGFVRAFYQTITTNSSQGYFENFMGDQASLTISESAGRVGIYKEPAAPNWDEWIKKKIIQTPVEEAPTAANVVMDVRETIAPPKHSLPVKFNDPYHKPHLENFFNSVRGLEKVNCPVEVGYETAVTVLKVNEAVKAQRELRFSPSDFVI
ncbi:MAG: Gfo/Idh/MocA family oxidoreductase [Melioribacteraceae bacterium]|nr:Gfo/Idh/MocA family oxidoreductase [Melioribacteraceae bacterium]